MNLPLKVDYTSDEGFGSVARLGVIVLETDQTVEAELGAIDIDGVDVYHARIPNDDHVSEDTLTAMQRELPIAAGLLPAGFGFDVIGYACTSAATLIGESGVAAAIRRAHPGMATTTPIGAAVAGFRALRVERIAIVTPYTADVTASIVAHFADAGIDASGVVSFFEDSDFAVARISEASVADAVRAANELASSDAVFVSCTSLRTFGVIAALEAELDKPVVSSNSAFAWHLLRLAGVDDPVPGLGALLDRH